MSIKPKFYHKILAGEKKVEYRKIAPKDVDRIFLYVSSPVQKILALIKVEKILIDKPEVVWNETKQLGGIEEEYFNAYSKDKKEIAAIFIEEIILLKEPLKLEKFKPPQNYLFRTDEEFSNMDY